MAAIETRGSLPFTQRPRRLGYGWLVLAAFLLWIVWAQIQWSVWLIGYSYNGPDYVGSTLLLHTWLTLLWRLFELVGWAVLLFHLRAAIVVLGASTFVMLCLAVYGLLIAPDESASGFWE